MGRYKIQQILITNLKHFKGEFPIELDGKNLLLYGENGSGKSSIYWALHLFYQSCLKTQDILGAGKYFDPNNDENLRNAYVAATDKSGVEIVFRMEGTTIDLPFHDTNLRIDTDSATSHKFM
jgi:predicted ATPase